MDTLRQSPKEKSKKNDSYDKILPELNLMINPLYHGTVIKDIEC